MQDFILWNTDVYLSFFGKQNTNSLKLYIQNIINVLIIDPRLVSILMHLKPFDGSKFNLRYTLRARELSTRYNGKTFLLKGLLFGTGISPTFIS